MIKVRVVQVNEDPKNTAELAAAVAAGHTDEDGWQMPRTRRQAISWTGMPRAVRSSWLGGG